MSKLNYNDHLYRRLVDLPLGGKIPFDLAKGNKDQWDRFIEGCKQFVRDNYGIYRSPQFYIEIANDGLSVRKYEYSSAKK